MNYTEALQFSKLVNKASEVKSFIDFIQMHKNQSIKSLYLVLEGGKQVEIKTPFSPESSKSIYDLLLKSRLALYKRLLNDIDKFQIDTKENRI